ALPSRRPGCPQGRGLGRETVGAAGPDRGDAHQEGLTPGPRHVAAPDGRTSRPAILFSKAISVLMVIWCGKMVRRYGSSLAVRVPFWGKNPPRNVDRCWSLFCGFVAGTFHAVSNSPCGVEYPT